MKNKEEQLENLNEEIENSTENVEETFEGLEENPGGLELCVERIKYGLKAHWKKLAVGAAVLGGAVVGFMVLSKNPAEMKLGSVKDLKQTATSTVKKVASKNGNTKKTTK